MSTHEPELTEPVDLCTTDGRLSPEATGWSRRPLHRCNLAGWGRNKRWDYWAVLAGDLVVSLTYADVDWLGIVDVWWSDLATGTTGGRSAAVPLARGVRLPDLPGTRPLEFRGSRLRMAVRDRASCEGSGPAGTRLRAEWLEADRTPARLDVLVALPEGHESLNVVIPWSERRFQFTSKHQARPVTGTLQVGGRRWAIGEQDDAQGVLDVGRGRWPYRTNWNWGGGAGTATDGSTVVGLQLGGRWTVGTGATENGVFVDGRLHKIGDELEWEYRWDRPMAPWRVRAPDGSVELRLEARLDKHSRTEAGVAGMEVHQVFGRWSGTVTAPQGRRLALEGVQGFAEEARCRW